MQKFPTFDLYDYKDIKCNFHTHTPRCKHATGTEREYVENAIAMGYKVLGFSDHAPYLFEGDHVSRIRMFMYELEDYVRTVEALKQEYKNDIQIFNGLEMEYFPKLFDRTLAEIKQYPMDYLILGQHYFDDEDGLIYTGSKWTEEFRLATYVERVITAIDTGNFLYVAHPDIIHYVGDAVIYEKHMRRLAQALKAHNMPIEINANGYVVGKQYPNKTFIELGVQEGCDFIVGVDAHNPQAMLDEKTYQGCIELAESLGGHVICK
ncbi:MAG: histidinol-phosphatase [Roseburia sp.]|nr:histidinol-phosphatase [Roseburia sp.]